MPTSYDVFRDTSLCVLLIRDGLRASVIARLGDWRSVAVIQRANESVCRFLSEDGDLGVAGRGRPS